jgi:hypothetical protein
MQALRMEVGSGFERIEVGALLAELSVGDPVPQRRLVVVYAAARTHL